MKLFIQSWLNKHGVSTSSFSEWKQSVVPATGGKINHLSTKLTTENNKNLLGLT